MLYSIIIIGQFTLLVSIMNRREQTSTIDYVRFLIHRCKRMISGLDITKYFKVRPNHHICSWDLSSPDLDGILNSLTFLSNIKSGAVSPQSMVCQISKCFSHVCVIIFSFWEVIKPVSSDPLYQMRLEATQHWVG